MAADTATATGNELTTEQLLYALSRMATIRRFEDTVFEIYRRGEMPGFAHLSVGQEAVAVGVCGALGQEDYIVSTHRGHGHCIAKGTSVNALMAEMLGRSDGICRGRGGTMHFADIAHGNVGALGIVGAGIGLGGGLALACSMSGNGRVVASFCGDGAMNEGIAYETMNLAVIWQLPLIFACENNLYGEYTPMASVTAGPGLTARAEAMGIPAVRVDGMDVSVIHQATLAAAERARSGGGPTFVEFETYRFAGHHIGDPPTEGYRTKAEVAEWRERDPIELAVRALRQRGVSDAEIDAVRAASDAEVAAALEFARASALPDPKEVEDFVYAC
jgi:acetoin:2,6-dichlorophenolindophenol oxidoreductase subunit alpha